MATYNPRVAKYNLGLTIVIPKALGAILHEQVRTKSSKEAPKGKEEHHNPNAQERDEEEVYAEKVSGNNYPKGQLKEAYFQSIREYNADGISVGLSVSSAFRMETQSPSYCLFENREYTHHSELWA